MEGGAYAVEVLHHMIRTALDMEMRVEIRRGAVVVVVANALLVQGQMLDKVSDSGGRQCFVGASDPEEQPRLDPGATTRSTQGGHSIDLSPRDVRGHAAPDLASAALRARWTIRSAEDRYPHTPGSTTSPSTAK